EVSELVFGLVMLFLITSFCGVIGISALLNRDLEKLSFKGKTRSETRDMVMDLAGTNPIARRARAYYLALDALFWSMAGATVGIILVGKFFGSR
ncbi:MAG: hypothetical protein AAF762_10050, partial [Pseudomonadota bacterium]